MFMPGPRIVDTPWRAHSAPIASPSFLDAFLSHEEPTQLTEGNITQLSSFSARTPAVPSAILRLSMPRRGISAVVIEVAPVRRMAFSSVVSSEIIFFISINISSAVDFFIILPYRSAIFKRYCEKPRMEMKNRVDGGKNMCYT